MPLSVEQFKELLQVVGSGKKGSFATCKDTYNGKGGNEELESFLASVNTFKKLERVSDEDALMGLPLVLKEDAAVWWQGVKTKIATWSEFEERLRHTFAPRKSMQSIYEEIINVKQGNQSTDKFVARKRMLFAQLPEPEHSEEHQLNMIFHTLHDRIRHVVSRRSIKTFDELLEKARGVEELFQDRDKEGSKVEETKPTTKKIRCNYCRITGHATDECRKLKKKNFQESMPKPQSSQQQQEKQLITAASQMPSPSAPKFSCYGCGTPGVVRSNCTQCSKPKELSIKELGFNSLEAVPDARERPIVFLNIAGVDGCGFIDSCAKSSLASYELYRCLKSKGYKFHQATATLAMADGKPRVQIILIVDAAVTICQRTIATRFVVFPEARHSKTLLGVGFIQDAMMILNIPQFTWHFIDEPNVEYELYKEDFVKFNKPQTNKKVEAVCPKNPIRTSDVLYPVEEGVACAETAVATLNASATYNPVHLATMPPRKRSREELFDGYSPSLMEALYRDAQINVDRMYDEIELSDDTLNLFPDPSDLNMASLDIDLSKSILNENQKMQFAQMLEENEEAFKASGKPATGVEHRIDTLNCAPISVPPYRLSPPKKEMLRAEVSATTSPEEVLGTYHASALVPFRSTDITTDEAPVPVQPLRRRGRPRKEPEAQKKPAQKGRGRGRPRKNAL
ncbi:retrotransposon gag protein domain-containing protein [Phthorimaea operculella]|nr:retrotransposon gag protein domain-containing protein [Phthorimaea operculella]